MGTDEAPAAWTSLVLLERFRGGDELAAEALFARYFERLTALARSRLSPRLARRTDPEDIVLSVYRSFFVEAQRGPLHPEPRRRPLAPAGVHHQAQAAPAGQAPERGPPVGRRRVPARSGRRREVRPAAESDPTAGGRRSRWPTSWNGSSRSWTPSGGACWNSGCRACRSRRSRKTRAARNAPCDDRSPRSVTCWPDGCDDA